MKKPISYAISYREWTDDLMSLSDKDAGFLLKALLDYTFDGGRDSNWILRNRKDQLADALNIKAITPEEWIAQTNRLNRLAVLWERMQKAADKSKQTYENYSKSNATNNKRGKGSARQKAEEVESLGWLDDSEREELEDEFTNDD